MGACMRSINPSVKLLGLMLLTFGLAAAQNPWMNGGVYLACWAVLLLSKVPIGRVIIRMLPILLVAVGMFFTGYRFADMSNETLNADRLGGLDPAVWAGLILSTRVLAFAGAGFVFALTTDKIDLVSSLQQQCRMPTTFAYAVLAAWNLLPDMEREYRRTRYAFLARGLRPGPFSPALVKPMVIKAVLWSQALAMAMESRGFDGTGARTEWNIVPVRRRDIVFLAFIVGAIPVLLRM